MMNRFIVIILLSMSLFFSCDIKLANDLYKDLYNDSTTKINFYSDKEENLPEGQTPLIYSCSYKIGNKITISELPDYKNSELAKWSNIKRVVGWKYYRWTESKTLIDDDRLITSIDISLNEIDLYAVYHTQYKVIYNFQNEDLSTYQKKEYIYYGESGSTVTITPDDFYGYNTPEQKSITIDSSGESNIEFIYSRSIPYLYVKGENYTMDSEFIPDGFTTRMNFNTIQEAVDFVESVDPNGCVESSIFVDGVIMQEPDAGVESLVTIGDGSNTPNIKIIGINDRASLSIEHKARGVFVNSNATVTISGVTISSGNSSNSSGGGIYNKGNLTLDKVIVNNCNAKYGGGICSEGSLTMNDGAVTNNTASNSGGGIHNTGYATLNNVNIEENTAQNSGGGIFAVQGSARLIMKGGSIYKNVAGGVGTKSGNGGGLRFYGIKGSPDLSFCQCQSYLYNVTITENSASDSGDGVYIISGAYLDLSTCTVIENGTQDIGLQGKLYLSMPESKIGTIYCSNTSDSVAQDVGIYVHPTFGNNKGGNDDKVEVTLEGYKDGLTLLTINEADQIGGFVDMFKLPDSVTDYEIVANGLVGQLKYIGTSIEDYSNFDHDEQMVEVAGKTFYYDNSSGKSSFVNGANTINSFYISKTEITQEVYKSVMHDITITYSSGTEQTLCENPSLCVQGSTENALPIDESDQDSRPVDNVTWYDAVYFCNKLSELKGREPVYTIKDIEVGQSDSDGLNHIVYADVTIDNTKNGYRLPTRSEWEFAFRGGEPTADAWNYCYSGKDSASYPSTNDITLDEIAWYYCNNDNGSSVTEGGITKDDVTNNAPYACGTHPVAKRAPNTLGLYDMSGNVYEWVQDLVMNGSDTNRILMGGSWFWGANRCSWKADLMHAQEKNSYAHYGFRIVCNE